MLLKHKSIRHNYTLLEMLAVIALISVLLNGALFFYNSGQKLCRQYEQKALEIKVSKIVKLYLRNFIQKNGDPFMVQPDKMVFKNSHSIYMNKHQLVFDTADNKKIISIPDQFTVSFAQENPPGENQLLIIYLSPNGTKGQNLADKATRIVSGISQTSGDKQYE